MEKAEIFLQEKTFTISLLGKNYNDIPSKDDLKEILEESLPPNLGIKVYS